MISRAAPAGSSANIRPSRQRTTSYDASGSSIVVEVELPGRDVVEPARLGPCGGDRDHLGGEVGDDDRAAGRDPLRRREAEAAGAAGELEHELARAWCGRLRASARRPRRRGRPRRRRALPMRGRPRPTSHAAVSPRPRLCGTRPAVGLGSFRHVRLSSPIIDYSIRVMNNSQGSEMTESVKRRYDSPRRREQAAETRRQILARRSACSSGTDTPRRPSPRSPPRPASR